MPVRKAVIPAAGLGTRFLPASKAVPKNLIPVVDRPIIQYAVEELARAGITDICIVTSRGTEALSDHFTSDRTLEEALVGSGKDELLKEVRRITDLAEIYYVYQHEPLGLGHAVGVAADHIGAEPFAVLLPDELFDPAGRFLSEMVQTFDESSKSVVAVHEVPHQDIRLYGAVDVPDPDAIPLVINGVVEKPHPDEAPSDLALSGRYVLTPEIFDIIAKLPPGAGGEIQLADALGVLAERDQLLGLRYNGRRWDVGNKEGYLRAVFHLASEHPELGSAFRKHVREAVAGWERG